MRRKHKHEDRDTDGLIYIFIFVAPNEQQLTTHFNLNPQIQTLHFLTGIILYVKLLTHQPFLFFCYPTSPEPDTTVPIL